MTKLCIKILVKSDSAIESAFPLPSVSILMRQAEGTPGAPLRSHSPLHDVPDFKKDPSTSAGMTL